MKIFVMYSTQRRR